MQKLFETGIEVDEQLIAGEKLPETMTLYAMDTDHLVITAKPIKTLEENNLTKMHVKVVSEQNRYVIVLPQKVYNFYHLDENDYTIMLSDKDPTTILITI